MWYDCQWDKSPQETKWHKKLTTIGHLAEFNIEQTPYRIVSYKRPRNDNIKQFKRENLTAESMKQNMYEKQICNT